MAQKKRVVNRTHQMNENLEFIHDAETRGYVQRQLIVQSDWYARESRKAKKVFINCSLAVLILNGLVTVLSVVADVSVWFQVLIALCGAAGAVINGYLTLANTKGRWITYRDNREMLISLLEQYRMGIGIFEEIADEAKRNKLLVKTCDTILNSEVRSWVTDALKEK